MTAKREMGLTSRQWRIYQLLKDECVGVENAKSGDRIIELGMAYYPDDFKGCRKIKDDINALRHSGTITRRIGSNPQKGYWLVTSADEAYSMASMKKHWSDELMTLIAQGVPKSWFYKVLNEAQNSPTGIDMQYKLIKGKEADPYIHTNSDDLKEGK